MEFLTEPASSGFLALCKVTTQRVEELKNYEDCDLLPSNDENYSDQPHF